MKVKDSSKNVSNRKKNALPSSKLLKPKKFKSLKKSEDGDNLSKKKHFLVSANINEQLRDDGDYFTLSKKKAIPINLNINKQLIDNKNVSSHDKSPKRVVKLKNSPQVVQEKLVSSPRSGNQLKETGLKKSKSATIPTLFDFDNPQSGNNFVKVTSERKSTQFKSSDKKKNLEKKNLSQNSVNRENKITKNTTRSFKPYSSKISSSLMPNLHDEKKFGDKVVMKSSNKHGKKNKSLLDQLRDSYLPGAKATGVYECKLEISKVTAVTEGLLKVIEESNSKKPEILDVGEPVFLQVECIKIPICPTKQLRLKLQHPLTDETSDVLLITADLKGHKIYPDKAVDYYEELLARHQINFINKVMPLRMVKKEYSQYEMKRKLVDQFDVILVDNRVIKSVGNALGKFALYNRKMPIPVNITFREQKLKRHLQDALKKTQMTIKSNGPTSVVQVGHSKMSANQIAANIVEVAKLLETLYPGGWKNIRSLVIKTAKSTSLPIYLSLLSPNEVKIPVEVRKKPEPVEGELSTLPGHNVIVSADGKVVLRKIEEDVKIDDTKDDEILEEAKKYMESSKTVRYDEDSSDEDKKEESGMIDSDNEGDAILEEMEKKLLNKYEKNVKAKKKNGKEAEEEEEEEEEDEEEESEEEIEIAPMIGKKRKSQGLKTQNVPPAKKKPVPIKGKTPANNKSNKENKLTTSPGPKKPQARGTRGGKKNKMSKDQRKALIKRKKAGKK